MLDLKKKVNKILFEVKEAAKLLIEGQKHALIILNSEGLVLEYDNNAKKIFPSLNINVSFIQEYINISNSNTKTFNLSDLNNLKTTQHEINCNFEVKPLISTIDKYLLYVNIAYQESEKSAITNSDPLLFISKDYKIDRYNKKAEELFDINEIKINKILLSEFIPEIYFEITENQTNKTFFKDITVLINQKLYCVSFQLHQSNKGGYIIHFLEFEEKEITTSIEKKYKAIIEANPDLFFVLSKEGIILDAIYSSEKELFYQPSFFINKNIIEVLPKEIWEICQTSLTNLNKTGSRQTFKYQFDVDNEIKYYEARLVNFNSNKVLAIIRDISEHEKSAQALKQERSLMQTLLDNSPVRIFFKDRYGKFVRVNHAMIAAFGLKNEDDMLGKTDFDFFTIEHAQKAFQIEQDIIKTGNSYLNVDEKNKWKNGKEDWSLNSKLPLYDNDRNIIGTFGITLDITERKRIEEELRESEERYRLFIEHSSDILVYLDENGVQKYISTSAERITGFTVDELKRSFIEVIHPDDLNLVVNGFQQLLAEPDKVLKGEYRHKCKDGSFKYMETIGRNYINHPNIKGIVTNVRDITDRKLTELALHKQNEEYENLNESLKESNALVVSINNALMDTIEELNKSEQKLRDQNEEYQALNEELIDSNNRIEIINTDLKKAKEKAEESDRLKSDFLANMSHEIRTPMNGLIGFSQMLAEPDISTERRLFYAKIIEQSCNQLLAIINDIIDISKIESKQMNVNKTKVNIIHILDKYQSFFYPSAKKKGIELLITAYPAKEYEYLMTDEIKLNQVLTNLIGNALKFTTVGSITFGCVVKEKFFEFYVKDTGIGIETENFNVIFDRFRQVETGLARSFGGTGLGLAISKAFVELLGGVIWIESIVDQGSTFYFTIPIDLNYEKLQL